MRILVLAAAAASLVMPATADETWLLPAPGIDCPAERQDVLPISVSPRGGMGIDGLDCSDVRLTRGRARSASCWANGGSRVDLDVDLLVLPSGAMFHDGVIYRRWHRPLPCPRS